MVKLLNKLLNVIILWFGFLFFACALGIAWNMTMMVFQVIHRSFFQQFMLANEPLFFGLWFSFLFCFFAAIARYRERWL